MAFKQFMYTNLAKGSGVDPASAGFQVKGYSPGLDETMRMQLESICMHYGNAVYRNAPRIAKDAEDAWRSKLEKIEPVPEEVLNKFPTIWSYDAIAEDTYSLTRICYRGFTHDNRMGNFFAHSLIFRPNDIEKIEYHPLGLIKSGYLLPFENSPVTNLAELPEYSGVLPKPDFSFLLRSPFKEHLVSLCSALSIASPQTRPVLICLPDWQDSVRLIECLLYLLPPSKRARTSFCSFESDRKWLIPTSSGARPTKLAAAHSLLVMCSVDGKSLDIRQDELNSVFAVYNFVENQFSSPGSPTRYSQFAIDCITHNRVPVLEELHELIELLGYGADPKAWDQVVSIAKLTQAKYDRISLIEALSDAVLLAKNATATQILIDRLLPVVKKLASEGVASDLKGIITQIVTLVERSDAKKSVGDKLNIIEELSGLTITAFIKGQGNTAQALLDCCGTYRNSVLMELLSKVFQSSPNLVTVNTDLANQSQIVTILTEGLLLVDAKKEPVPFADTLLVKLFEEAQTAQMINTTWEKSSAVVKSRLKQPWSTSQEQLARKLMQIVSIDACPEGNSWLSQAYIAEKKPRGAELILLLEQITRSCTRISSGDRTLDSMVNVAREAFPDPIQLSIALGRMAEAAYNTSLFKKMFGVYEFQRKKTYSDQKNHRVLQELALAGVQHLLWDEFLKSVIPWQETKDPSSAATLSLWQREILKLNESVNAFFYENVAQQLLLPDYQKSLFPLAENLLIDIKDKSQWTSSRVALLQAFLTIMPLISGSDRITKILSNLPDTLHESSLFRINLIRFMDEVSKQVKKDAEWSLQKFDHTDSRWQEARKLSEADKEAAINWLIELMQHTGLKSASDAEKLVSILGELHKKSPANVAGIIERLLANRDPVSSVQTIMAFVLSELTKSSDSCDMIAIVRAILHRVDRSTYKLFEEHLEKHFHPDNDGYVKRLDAVMAALDMQTTSKTKSDVMTKASETIKSVVLQNQPEPVSSLLKNIPGKLKSLFSRQPENSDSDQKKKKNKDDTKQ